MTTIAGCRDSPFSAIDFLQAALRQPTRSFGIFELVDPGTRSDDHEGFLALKRDYISHVRRHGVPAMGGPQFLRCYPGVNAELHLRSPDSFLRRYSRSDLNPSSSRPRSRRCDGGRELVSSFCEIDELFDFGQVGETFFTASRYYFGVDLERLASWLRANGRTLPWSVGVALFRLGCSGLGRLHGLHFSGRVTPRHLRVCLGAGCLLAICRPILRVAGHDILPEPPVMPSQDLVSLAAAVAALLPPPRGVAPAPWHTDPDYLREVPSMLSHARCAPNELLRVLLSASSTEPGPVLPEPAAEQCPQLVLPPEDFAVLYQAAAAASLDTPLLDSLR